MHLPSPRLSVRRMMALMVVAAILSRVAALAYRRSVYLEAAAKHAAAQDADALRVVGHRLLASGEPDAAYAERLAREDASAFARMARHRRLQDEYERAALAPWAPPRIEVVDGLARGPGATDSDGVGGSRLMIRAKSIE